MRCVKMSTHISLRHLGDIHWQDIKKVDVPSSGAMNMNDFACCQVELFLKQKLVDYSTTSLARWILQSSSNKIHLELLN